jgi:hypothetical protein
MVSTGSDYAGILSYFSFGSDIIDCAGIGMAILLRRCSTYFIRQSSNEAEIRKTKVSIIKNFWLLRTLSIRAMFLAFF